MQIRRCLLVLTDTIVAVAAFLLPMQGNAASAFADLVTFANSVTTVSGHLCSSTGDATIGCDNSSPYVATGGLVGIGTETPAYPLDVSGTVRATRFMGDGSGLTGVVASTGDRIVSGTTSMVADGTSGLISITQAGTSTAYFHPQLGLVTVGVSSTGTISTTFLDANTIKSAGNVTIGGGIFLPVNSIYWGNGVYASIGGTNQNDLRLATSGTEAMRIVSNGYVGIGTSAPSANLHVVRNFSGYSFGAKPPTVLIENNGSDDRFDVFATVTGARTPFRISNKGSVGIGITSGIHLMTAFNVSGTIKMADGGEACDTDRKGAIKYASSEFYVCRNGTAWESLTSVANNATPDRLVSGTASAILNPDGTLATQNLTAWGAGITALKAGNVVATQSVAVGGSLTAANIQASGTVQVGTTGAENEGCTLASDIGKIRVNPVSHKFQICRYYN